MKRSILILVLFLLNVSFFSENAYAQSDTVRYRLLKSWLSDSTIFRYELGSICFTSLGTQKYLKFANNTNISTVSSWFKTEPFTIASLTDSMSFFRFASFDDKNDPGILQADTLIENSFDSLSLKWYYRYVDTEFFVIPSSAYFNNTSTVLYTVTLKKVSDNSVVTVLDTLACYLNNEGKLRYTTYPSSMNIQYCSLAGISIGTELYVFVNRISSLPTGSTFIHDEFEVEAINKPYPDSLNSTYSVGDRDWETYPSPMPYSNVRQKKIKPNPTVDISGNPIEKIFKLTVASESDGIARTEVYSTDGKRILSTENRVSIGNNLLLIDGSHLPAGAYTIEVTLNGTILLRAKRIVIH